MSSDRPKSKVQVMREQRRRQQMAIRWMFVGGIALLAVVSVFALTRFGSNATPTPMVTIPVASGAMEYPQANDNAMGDPNAPITITEYSDFQCPYCARFATQTEPQLIETYIRTGKVRFIYRSMGDWIGPESLAAANAAYCAGEQNQYWPYHATVFANWAGENEGAFSDDNLLAFAGGLGLDMDNFRACFESGKYEQRALEDQTAGMAAGVQGTPFFLITYTVDGEAKQRSLPGAYPFEDFQTEIEAALAEMGLNE